ncbi:hypothetical protein EIP91_003021 [Steccherinum ochraceum]|uniref:F-box domain-containing protein n=1 Tax=Steccherinum ochraceum TaxID=92696 RepID=A0A4R0RHD8_9APHY|nr:hypothetical protein EIP91_003021 [Steccherinum ochraceum]
MEETKSSDDQGAPQIDVVVLPQCDDYAPIHRLPPEILNLIFVACQDAVALPARHKWSNTRSIHRWVRVIQVCHYWREVGLNTPRLWTDIYMSGTDSPQRIRTFLERSQQAPLTITIRDCSSIQQETLCAVIAEIARAERVDIEMSCSDFERIEGINCWPSIAPLLRSLKTRDVSRIKAVPDTYRVFFAKVLAPSLEHLDTDCSLVDWMPGAAPVSLTTLLVANSQSPYAVTSVESVIEFLARLPHLERLELVDALEPIPAQAVSAPPHKKVALPRMRRLCLTEPTTSCARLLGSLDLPVSQIPQITMKLDMCSMDYTSLMAAVPILSALVQDISPNVIIIQEHPGNAKFDLTVYDLPDDPDADPVTVPFIRMAGTTSVRNFRVAPVGTPPLAPSLCYNLLARLPLELVTSCSLHTNAPPDDPIWDGIARALPAVEHLVTPAFPVPTELQIVVTALGACGDSVTPKYRMANATKLTLYNIRFRDRSCEVGAKTKLQELLDLLLCRREAGCPPIQKVWLGRA